MKYTPHEYQKYATDFILRKPEAAIFLDCGLGKTMITLQAIYELCLDRFEISRVLVIAPLRVAATGWPGEIEKFSESLDGLTYSVAVGDARQRKEALKKKAFVYVINRENVDWLISKSGLPFNYDMVVLDELSSWKDKNTVRYKALMDVRPRIKRIVGLTGTPAANSLIDLFAEFKMLDLGKRLGRYITRYREEFFVPDRRNGMQVYSWKPVIGSEQRIFDAISDITISMKNTDYLDMPELVLNEVPVYMNDHEKTVYKTMKSQLAADVGTSEITAMNAASLSNKLLQMANGRVYDDNGSVVKIHSRKIEALEDLIESANGNPVMIAYWFKHDLEAIQEKFPYIRQIKTAKDISDWNAGKIKVACLHPASCSHGLNLQHSGNILIFYGLTWSLDLWIQTYSRLWRQGMKHPTVIVHHIITTGTIDEQVMDALKRKDKTQAALMDAVKAEIGKE